MASFVRKLSLLKNGLATNYGTRLCSRTSCGPISLFLNNFKQNGSGFCSQVPLVNNMTNNELNIHNELEKNEEAQSQLDVLYKRLEVEVRGHDRAVLKSYEWFAMTAANHLGITVSKTWIPPVQKIRRRALKSAHAHGKHIVQYEFRTYFRIMEFVKLTGSTADTYLEYIQRNLPEGVAMKVTRERIEKIPPHIKPPLPTTYVN